MSDNKTRIGVYVDDAIKLTKMQRVNKEKTASGRFLETYADIVRRLIEFFENKGGDQK